MGTHHESKQKDSQFVCSQGSSVWEVIPCFINICAIYDLMLIIMRTAQCYQAFEHIAVECETAVLYLTKPLPPLLSRAATPKPNHGFTSSMLLPFLPHTHLTFRHFTRFFIWPSVCI